MDLFRALDVSASGLAAQRARIDVITENIANSETTRTAAGGPYRRKVVLLQAVDDGGFARLVNGASGAQGGVEVTGVVETADAPRRVHQPGHPHAGPDGYVDLPNVNPVTEMADMLMTTRTYEANATAFQASRSMAARLLELLR